MPDAISLTASGSGQTGASTGLSLVTQIARIVGGEGEGEIRSQALDCLNRVRIELNQHDWTFMKTTDDPITLVNGTAGYTLDSTFRKPSYAYLIDSGAIPRFDLEYINDESVIHQNPDLGANGRPVYYMLRNDFQDGYVNVYPTPDATAATNYRLVVEYFARIGAFSDSTDTIDIPEECTNVLVIGGQAYLLRERQKGSPASALAFADYQRVKNLLLADDRRVTDEKPRFRIGVRRGLPLGTVLIQM